MRYALLTRAQNYGQSARGSVCKNFASDNIGKNDFRILSCAVHTVFLELEHRSRSLPCTAIIIIAFFRER